MFAALGFEQLKELAHIGLNLIDFIRPAARCPDCVCEVATPIVREVVPEALSSALRFAQEQCAPGGSGKNSSSHCWSFSLFWWGLCVGAFLAFSVVVGLALLRRLLSSGSSGSALAVPEAQPLPRPAQVLASPAAPLALGDGEPANPRTLRQLGILR